MSATLAFSADALAQSNQIPGLDASLVNTFSLTQRGRAGGVVALSAGVDICNFGSADIGWFAPMNPDHPMYSFMVTREVGDRFEQISDRSWVKHGFLSINGSVCMPCSNPSGSGQFLFPACSDTYGSSLNASRTYLGPPQEIDPWLGVWSSVGSFFDQGLPPVGGAAGMDNNRSSINPPSDLTNRMQIQESDLMDPSANYFYGSYVVVRGEPGANRNNNFVNRRFIPSFNGSSWNFANGSGSVSQPMLMNWQGAIVNQASDGNDDGAFFVGVKVTGPDAGTGLYHYEYAVHNRDNSRGAAAFRLPKSDTASISNVYVGDLDNNAANDWTVSITTDEVAFMAGPSNALEWNSIFNFAFDSDEAPTNTSAQIDHALPGSGQMTLSVVTQAPGGEPAATTNVIGEGCPLPAVFYESFGAGSDLYGTSLELTASGNGFSVDTCASNCFDPVFGTNLNMGDETFSNTLNLGFTINLPGGVSTSSIRVSSNGWISLQPGAFNNTDFNQAASKLVAQGPRLAPLWEDLDAGGGGGGDVFFKAAPGVAVVTFDAVEQWNQSGTSNTFQVQFLQNGSIKMFWDASNTSDDPVIGYSPGGVANDPGPRDLSAVPYQTGSGGTPLALGSTPPALGQLTTLTMSNLPVGALDAILYAGLGQQNIDLGFLDAPGCFFGTSADFLTGMSIGGTSATFSFVVPNDPALVGGNIFTQGIGVAVGLPSFGFATTNVLQLTFGN